MDANRCNEFWQMADKDKNGSLSIHELKAALSNYGCQLSDQAIAEMFTDIDRDGSKSITKEEFFDEMLKRPKRTEALKKAFSDFDKDGNGVLSQKECMQLIKAADPSISDKRAECMIKAADKNGDGEICIAEFMKICE